MTVTSTKAPRRSYRIRSSVHAQRIHGTWVVLEQSRTHYQELNESAGFLWERLRKPATAQQLIATLQRRYHVDKDTATRDVTAFLSSYVQQGFLEVV